MPPTVRTFAEYISPDDTQAIVDEAAAFVATDEPRCTGCGYCSPCPQSINVGACLSYYNLAKYMGMAEAGQAFRGRQWDDTHRLDLCQECGDCESRCPNALPVVDIIRDARAVLYGS